MPLIKITNLPCADCGGQMKKGGWIQEATRNMRKDKPCTGSKFGGPSCPPGSKRYNLAKTFRSMAKKRKGKNEGGYIMDDTGLGTYLYDQPLEMQLNGINPIIGGPMDVMAMDEYGKKAYIPAYSQDPTYMYGNVREIPLMKSGGKTPISMSRNKSMPYYNPHRDYMYDFHSNTTLNPSYQDDVRGMVKSVDRDEANIEAEKGEIKLKPGMMGLHKIGGKSHSQGGTPLYAEGGSFIFSNDKDLYINKDERELFEFKKFNSKSAKKNTPAKILEREVSPKEYNKMINILQDDKYDSISKKSAALMLEKMQKKIGQVAFIQEAKKSEPIPEFAMGSSPLVKPEIQEDKKEQISYRKGGYYQTGGIYPPIYPGGRTKAGRTTPTGQTNIYDFPLGDPKEKTSEELAKRWKKVGVDLKGTTQGEAQRKIYDWAIKNNPDLIRENISQFGMTNLGRSNIDKIRNLGIPVTQRNGVYDFEDPYSLSDQQLGEIRDLNYVDQLLGVRTFAPRSPLNPTTVTPVNYDVPDIGKINAPDPSTPQDTVNTVPSLPYEIKGKLTPSQLAHLGQLGLQAMSINKYYPKRQQVVLPEVDLNTINQQPYINAINNQTQQAYNAASISSPQMANIQSSNIYGRGLDAITQTVGNIANQNSQIQNQENMANLQQRTNQILANTQFDERYFDQVQKTRQNYDDERRFAQNQFMSNLNQYQSQADKLAWALSSVNKYGKRRVVDPRTGKLYDQPVPLYEYKGDRIVYNQDVADVNLASGADRFNSISEAQKLMQSFNVNPNQYQSVYALARLIDAMSGRGKQPVYNQNPYLPNQ